MGLSSAYYAAKSGHKVTLIERDGESAHGCSWGNAGMIVPSHFVPLAEPGVVTMGLKMLFNPEGPFAIKPSFKQLRWGWLFMRSATAEHVQRSIVPLRDLSLLSRKLYEALAEESGDAFGLEKRGLLMLCPNPHVWAEEKEFAKKANEIGVRARVLDAEETAAADPTITMNVAGSVHFEDDCHLSPPHLLDWLRASLKAQGAEILYGKEAQGWVVENGKIKAVKTVDGQIEADEFVLAAGAWSPEVAREIGLNIPMQAGKGYGVTLANPPQLPTLCSILAGARVAVTPMGSSLRVAGTMELAGNDLSINRRRLRGIFKSVPKYFPEFKESDFEGLDVWSGLRPCSPDGLPYIGRINRVKNLVVATGHAMMGVSLGPATGKLVAEILDGQTPSVAIDRFNVNRFDLNDLKAVS